MTRARDQNDPERMRDLDPELARVFDATAEPQLSAAQLDRLVRALEAPGAAEAPAKLVGKGTLALKLGAALVLGTAVVVLLLRWASPPRDSTVDHTDTAVSTPTAAETASAQPAAADQPQLAATPGTEPTGEPAQAAAATAAGAPSKSTQTDARRAAQPPAAMPRGPQPKTARQNPAISAANPAGPVSPKPEAHPSEPSQDRASSSASRPPVAGPASELQLLERAQQALTTSAREALALTDEHQRLYPHGRFAEEREQVAIEALARVGADSALAARARRFLETYPRSAYAARVAALVKGREPPP